MDDSIYRLRLRDVLALCVLALLFIGIIMVQSAAMNVVGDPSWRWSQRGIQHLINVIAAIAAFFIVGHINYDRLYSLHTRRSPIVWLLAVAIFACLIVLIPGIGIEKNGARRWIWIIPQVLQVQPSELGKWAVVLFLAWWLTTRPQITGRFTGLLLTLAPVGLICLLVVVHDLGTAALIALCAFTMLLVGGVRLWHLAVIIPPALGAAVFFIMGEPYRRQRLLSFLDPWAAPQAEGYHMIQSLLSFATGGVFGRGLGNGIQKLGYLPEDTTDFIFAVICEELGLCGALLVVVLYLGIVCVAWQVVRQNRDNFGRMLAFGIASMLSLQALINIAVATVSVPTKGLSLPLISAGGSGLVITCAALGVLYSVVRYKHAPETDSNELQDGELRVASGDDPQLTGAPTASPV